MAGGVSTTTETRGCCIVKLSCVGPDDISVLNCVKSVSLDRYGFADTRVNCLSEYYMLI